MSKVLIIKHLPNTLSLHDKELLLKHFGAEKVWETRTNRNYIFASFASIEKAKASLLRLHQLEIAQRRLVVEYSTENEPLSHPKKENEQTSAIAKKVDEFLRKLNAWNPSINFFQPPPSHLKYKYPDISPKTVINIIYALFSHTPLYTQTVHLMNKMSLETPFEENDKALNFFKETFREYFIHEINIPMPQSESESELSDEKELELQVTVPAVVKRKHTLPKTRKRPAAVLSTAILPKAKKKVTNQEEVFEGVPIQEQKKISLVVAQDALAKQPEITAEVIGELGKFEKEPEIAQEPESLEEPEQPTITKKELLQNRISYSDMKVLPVFKNYHPGEPSMRLYIKNLAKTVTEQDVKRIYRRYIENLGANDQLGFDVRVMKEGRMKGQAFVTFPSVKIAEQALNETNGFILNDKPMVVQFARAANKKPSIQ